MKDMEITNNPSLVKRLAKLATGKGQFNRRQKLAALIKEQRETRKIIEAIYYLRVERKGALSLTVTDDSGDLLVVKNGQAITNALDYMECFLDSRADFLNRVIDSFDV